MNTAVDKNSWQKYPDDMREILHIFRRHDDGIYLVEAADFETAGENSAYDPAVVQKGDIVNWLEAADNSWGVPVLNVWPVTYTMLSVTGNEQFASNAVSWRAAAGALPRR